MIEFNISENDKNYLLCIARKQIADKLKINFNKDCGKYENLNFNSGCFVTLHIDGNLRGCIGNFREDTNIIQNVKEMAISAAFSDPRFPPLESEEFNRINIEISVLSPMIKINSLNDIKIGRDGLYIKKGFYSGVLLPQVATEYNWSVEEFLSHTCVKAGLPSNYWQVNKLDIYRFEAVIFSE
jgi:AmmeMemoRadiSam system protein A